MKNLLTFVLLVFSLTAFGQSNSQTVEIKYWKSIAESNDTVAYREYLQRYGENGLYYDEAITRIALLKTSGKQAQSQSMECCFYTRYTGAVNIQYVIRFDAEQSKVWLKHIDYDTVRSNLAGSRDFYENQATLALTRGTWEYENAISNDKNAIKEAEYASKYEKNRRKKAEALQKAEQAKSPDYYKNAWTKDEEYQYSAMISSSARDVYFKRDGLHEIEWTLVHSKEVAEILGRNFNSGKYYKYDDEYDEKQHKDGHGYSYKTKRIQGYRYVAFSKDKSSIIMWFEEDDNLDGKILEKREYKRVSKEDLLPKAVNYDFLNK